MPPIGGCPPTRRGARKEKLNHHADDVHIAKAPGEKGDGPGRCKDEHDGRTDKGGSKVDDAVGQPCEHIQHDVLVGRQDITEICAIEDVLEGGQDANPDGCTVPARDESASTHPLVSEYAPKPPPPELDRDRGQGARARLTGRRRRGRARMRWAERAERTGG